MPFNRDNASKCGKKGGRTTVRKHGRQHMSKIGRKGFEQTTNLYFGGDENAHKEYMAEMGRWQYFTQTGLRLKHDRDGNPIFRRPQHPANKPGDVPF